MKFGNHHYLFFTLCSLFVLGPASFVAAEEQVCTAEGDCTSTSEAEEGEKPKKGCNDDHDQCEFWGSVGECESNPGFMHATCAKSCGTCKGYRQLTLEDGSSFGEAQQITGARRAEMDVLVAETEKYMREEVHIDPKYKEVRAGCQNRNELCAFWAVIGECEANPKFMQMECAPSCKTCINLDFNFRCPLDNDAPTIWGPGDLNKMFEKITQDPYYQQYTPTILSQPGVGIGNYKDDGPWVVTLDNVISDEECEELINLGGVRGYEQSFDVGKKKYDGTYDKHLNTQRTSTNAWCVEDCYNHTTTQNVINRLENITGIPDTNSEYLQLLRYEIGQKYGQHHDYIDYQKDRQCGVRIITVFLYLNDVEAGGGTNFPLLGNMTVLPKKGSVLVWPSVLDQNPNHKDGRTDHQALPVEAGTKYGANAWVHQRSFKEPFAKSCI